MFYSLWGRKESDTTQQLNNNKLFLAHGRSVHFSKDDLSKEVF